MMDEKAIDEIIDDYVLEADNGSYYPTEHERFLIKDFLMGFIAEREWLDKAGLVVKPETCPNPSCGNTGVYPTEPDGEPEQCEFCYSNRNSVFNFLESIKPEPPAGWDRNDLPF